MEVDALEQLGSLVESPSLQFSRNAQRDVIEATFEDEKVALMKVVDTAVVADQDAAQIKVGATP